MLTKQTFDTCIFKFHLGSKLNIHLINGTMNTWIFGSGRRLSFRECILMTSKNENLHTVVILSLHQHIPDFSPLMAISDFKSTAKLFFFPHILLVGCWFHYTKDLHDKIQKLGLSNFT